MQIEVDDLSRSQVHALLQAHLDAMHANSPPGSVHALDLGALKLPEITFWTAWDHGQLLGCGALKELDANHAEIKSMRTADAHLRKGVARSILAVILQEAGKRAYRRVSLETGSGAAFAPAHSLYEHFGFRRCGPFGAYVEDHFSVFMTKQLSGQQASTSPFPEQTN